MININEINEAIENFENKSSTTYDNCMKLAALYIVRDHYYDKTLSAQGGMILCEMDKRQDQDNSIQIKK